MKSIVFVHGFSGGKNEYQPIIKYLKKKGISNFHQFEYKENLGQVSLISIAEKLKTFIDKNILSDDKVFIIGISQGGIISSYYLEFLKGKKIIKNCICLCTPFHGSKLAQLFNLPGIKELRLKSGLLSKLKKRVLKSKINYYGVWNPLDLVIFPGKNAFFKAFKESIKVTTLLHQLSFCSKKTKEFIYKIISKY